MYNYNDNTAAIRALQNMLYQISKNDNELPTVYADGIYGAETKECVGLIQQRNQLEPTGTVDFESFEVIRSEYGNSIKEDINKVNVLPEILKDGVLSKNDESTTVVILQSMLQELSYMYEECENVKLNGVLDNDTVTAIEKIQEVHSLEQTGEVDIPTWNAITIEYEKFRGEG